MYIIKYKLHKMLIKVLLKERQPMNEYQLLEKYQIPMEISINTPKKKEKVTLLAPVLYARQGIDDNSRAI